MKKVIIVLLAVSVSIAFHACRKNDAGNEKKPDIPHDNQSVKVMFPQGMTVNYTDYTLFSLADDSKLDASGNASVSYNKGSTNVAWLFDKDNNPVMAGFVNDTAKTIDAVSTAKVLLYYAYAIPLLPEEVGDAFVKDIGKVSGFTGWVNTFTNLLRNDKLALSQGAHLTPLKNAMQAMSDIGGGASGIASKGTETMMAAGKPDLLAIKNSDIRVSFTDAKSGLLVFSKDLGKVNITNYHRRRAHAFFYKTKYKDLNGVEKAIIAEINETTVAEKNESLSPTSAANSATAILGNLIEGKMMEFAEVEGGPYNFPLQDNESEATYKLRIVGPGQQVANVPLTRAESDKLFSLQIETIAVDFLLPVIASFISSKIDFKPGENATQDQKQTMLAGLESFKTIVEEMVKAVPGVYDDMKKGKFDQAVQKILEAVYAGHIGAAKEGFVKMMALVARMAVEQKYYVSPHYDELASAKRWNKIMEAVDKVMMVGDYAKILYDLNNSKTFEEWELLLRSGKVTLQFVSGHDSLLNTSDETKIQAEIKNMQETGGDQHPYFEWSTTGKYGKLVDTKGHSGTSFGTADHIISYQSTTNSNDLGDGDNIDYIYVKASFSNVQIGMDTIAVNVKKVNYEMKPDNGTVTGKKHDNAANNITLYLSKVVTGVRDIPNHANLDFKVEWSTPGVYGNLVGATTTYNDDDIVYKATNDQVGVFTENITAKVYAKNKGETEYFLYSNVKGKVKIDNEEKKKIYHVPLVAVHTDTSRQANVGTCATIGVAYVPIEKDAIKYAVRSMGTFNGLWDRTISWNAGNHPAWFIGYGLPRGITGNNYTVAVAQWGAHSYPLNNPHHESQPQTGTAEVTVWLK